MDERSIAIAEAEVPQQRSCTRCDGTQHLVAAQAGLGKYRCDTCELAVGFDLHADPAEFLLHRGLPSRYTTTRWFGERLTPQERRLLPTPLDALDDRV